MKVKVLASGSKGNATLVEANQTKILVDCGLTYRTLVQKLESVDADVHEIGAVFITHEHSDHIKGLKTFINKHKIPIFLSEGSYNAVVNEKGIGIDYEHFHIVEDDQQIDFNDFIIHPFLISHDAYEPFGYRIYEGDKKLVYLTDTGFVSQLNEERIKNADVYILETNHNVEMLMCSNRPWYLKQRILGDFGHLCNEDALEVLSRVKGDKTKYVYLAHISEEANNLDLLHLTVDNYCKRENDFRLIFYVAHQHQPSEIVDV